MDIGKFGQTKTNTTTKNPTDKQTNKNVNTIDRFQHVVNV